MSLEFTKEKSQFTTIKNLSEGKGHWIFATNKDGQLLLIVPNRKVVLNLSTKASYPMSESISDSKVKVFEGDIILKTDKKGDYFREGVVQDRLT